MDLTDLLIEKVCPVTENAIKTITKRRVYSFHEETVILSSGVLNEMNSLVEKGDRSRTPELLKRSIKI